jgi:hypothetical protein
MSQSHVGNHGDPAIGNPHDDHTVGQVAALRFEVDRAAVSSAGPTWQSNAIVHASFNRIAIVCVRKSFRSAEMEEH